MIATVFLGLLALCTILAVKSMVFIIRQGHSNVIEMDEISDKDWERDTA